jgi:hypothetical protein
MIPLGTFKAICFEIRHFNNSLMMMNHMCNFHFIFDILYWNGIGKRTVNWEKRNMVSVGDKRFPTDIISVCELPDIKFEPSSF